jgi:hypothetical protein
MRNVALSVPVDPDTGADFDDRRMLFTEADLELTPGRRQCHRPPSVGGPVKRDRGGQETGAGRAVTWNATYSPWSHARRCRVRQVTPASGVVAHACRRSGGDVNRLPGFAGSNRVRTQVGRRSAGSRATGDQAVWKGGRGTYPVATSTERSRHQLQVLIMPEVPTPTVQCTRRRPQPAERAAEGSRFGTARKCARRG